MSRRNFILLIIVLVIAGVSFWLWYTPEENSVGKGDKEVGTNFLSQFGFGGNSSSKKTTPEPKPIDVSGYEPQEGSVMTAKLTKISSMGVAGYGIFSKERIKEIAPISEENTQIKAGNKTPAPKTVFVPAVRYVAKATGNIYQTFADKIKEDKFSKTLVPKIYDAYFGNKAQTVVMRYLKEDGRTIETFVGALPKEYLGSDTNGNNEVRGFFLPDNVKDISVSRDATKIFYLFENANGNIIGTVLNLATNGKTQVFDSPFTEWLSEWGNGNTINLNTKPSSSLPGYMYTLDQNSKNLTKVLGEISGLTTSAAPNGKLLLYADGNLSLFIYHTDTRNSDLLAVKTLPEKCVWGKQSDFIYCAVPKAIPFGEYPDSWYQGEVSFNDQIWKIDVKTGNSTLALDPVTATPEGIDAVKLATDEGENYLFFINKKDSFLWKLDLK